MLSKIFSKQYNRMGYFYTKNYKGTTGYSTYSKGTPSESLIKKYKEYIENPISQPGFGIGLVDTTNCISTLCIDIDAHNGETDKKDVAMYLIEYLAKHDIKASLEQNENTKGFHIWITGEDIMADEASGLLSTINKMGTEVYPMLDENCEASRFIRLPGLYKDGIGKSYVEQNGNKVYLTSKEAVQNFFDSCFNDEKSLLQILGEIKEYFTKEHQFKFGVETKETAAPKRKSKKTDGSKRKPCTEDELNRVVELLESESDVFQPSKTDRYNFNSNRCLECLQETEIKSLLISGKDSSLADDIIVGIDRTDRSNEHPNSFAVVERYPTSRIVKSICFLRNRDNAGVVLFDNSRKWTVNDLIDRAPDLPQLENIYTKVKLEKILTPCFSSPYIYNYRVSYDFINQVDLANPKTYNQENKAQLGAAIGLYIKNILGCSFTKNFSKRESEITDFLNSLYLTRRSYYSGGIVNELVRVSETEYSSEELDEAYTTILDIVNLDTDKTPKHIFRTFLEVLFKKASMRLYNCLPNANDDMMAGIESVAIKTAIEKRIELPLTNALVVMGNSGSGKTTLLRLICEGISSVVGFGTKNYIHPTRSDKANIISGASIDNKMDVSASLYANIGSYFTEYNPKPSELELSQALIVGFLTKMSNTDRYAHEKHIISDRNLCCFLGFDTDCSSIFSFKAGNKRRFLPVWLKKRENRSDENLHKVSESVKYIVEYYLNQLFKNNVPFFSSDYVFSDEISNYISSSIDDITKVKNDLIDTLSDYTASLEMYSSDQYQVRPHYLEAGLKGVSQYSNCSYAYIFGKTVSSVLNQFYGWKEGRLGSFKEESQEVASLAKILKERGIEKKVCKLNGNSVRVFKVLFVVPQFDSAEE